MITNFKKNTLSIYRYSGDYGGDIYEQFFEKKLKERVACKSYIYPRLGGIKTIISLLKLILCSFADNSRFTVRPFGLPIYKKNLIVIFHHYDHNQNLNWYTKLFESFDLHILKILSKRMGIKIICVSKYWKNWLKKNINAEIIIYYNECNHLNSIIPKKILAKKYSLDERKKWIFLGSISPMKGGGEIATISNNIDYCFIQSGKIKESNRNINVRWFEENDYLSFIKHCEGVISNSKFNEGWCRVAHEAIYMNTPCTGSGRGGMSELFNIVNTKYSKDPHKQLKIMELMIDDKKNMKKKYIKLHTYINKANYAALKVLITE